MCSWINYLHSLDFRGEKYGICFCGVERRGGRKEKMVFIEALNEIRTKLIHPCASCKESQ